METKDVQVTNPVSNPSAGLSPAGAETAYGEAFQRRLAEISAVSPSELLPVNVDIRAAVATALGALPKLKALRPQVAKLADFDMGLFDGLEDYAQAAGHAHSKFLGAAPQAAELAQLYDEAVTVRDTLQFDMAALTHRGLVDSKRIEQFKGLVGYKNVSFDVMGMADVLIELWPNIEGKTALTLADLRAAKQTAEKLVAAFGAREQSAPTVAEAALLRQKTFTLFARSYDHVRRAVSFLRWKEGDAETIAPSLYAGRGGRGKSDTSQDPPATAPAGTTPGTPVTPAGGVPTAPGTPAPVAHAPAPGTEHPVGAPGGSPFIS